MIKKMVSSVLFSICASLSCAGGGDDRPNILVILADDLGYSDLGFMGSEISTPNLDSLAASGAVLTSFHTAPTCGPSRAMLMTGVDHHRVGMGANAAAIARLTELQGLPGYEGYLNQRVDTVATLLEKAGYQTYMVGKWDLGTIPGTLPSERGFQRSFALLNSGASHFSDARGTFSFEPEAVYLEDGMEVDSLPDDFYSTEYYTAKMIDYVEQGSLDEPYFGYVAYTAPHWPLQVPDDWLDRYSGVYDSGWSETALNRLQAMRGAGLISGEISTELARGAAEWDSMSPEEQRAASRTMEIYAAMIEYMDQQIGILLKSIKLQENKRETVIFFLSDNGPEGNAIDRIGDTGDWVQANFDLSFDNYGRMGSYLFAGAGWSQVSAQPLHLYKSYISEGGIRTPAIVHYSDRALPARIDAVTTIMDIPATILELAGATTIAVSEDSPDKLAMEGKSLLPLMLEGATEIHQDEPIGWELYGNRALIKSPWKARLLWPPEGDGEWELFNILDDPAEQNDLAVEYPNLLQNLISEWEQYVEDNGMHVYDRELGYGRY
jgi:arylsulfatase